MVRLMKRREPETVLVEEPEDAVGKGRPTPKRREATGVRGPVTAPKTRKEAYARQKEQSKAARTASKTPASKMTAAQRRAAMKSGDPSVLPRRDQGATRKLARDWVDSHRMASNYLLLLFPMMILSWIFPVLWILQLLVLASFLGFIAEWVITGRRIRALTTERYGRADGSSLSIGFYAGSRAYLRRSWRMPSPQVELGQTI